MREFFGGASDVFRGTPAYRSPEQQSPLKTPGIDHRSDIFSFGIMAYSATGVSRHPILNRNSALDPTRCNRQAQRHLSALSRSVSLIIGMTAWGGTAASLRCLGAGGSEFNRGYSPRQGLPGADLPQIADGAALLPGGVFDTGKRRIHQPQAGNRPFVALVVLFRIDRTPVTNAPQDVHLWHGI